MAESGFWHARPDCAIVRGMTHMPVICLSCSSLYLLVRPKDGHSQLNSCPDCGYAGWLPAPPSGTDWLDGPAPRAA